MSAPVGTDWHETNVPGVFTKPAKATGEAKEPFEKTIIYCPEGVQTAFGFRYFADTEIDPGESTIRGVTYYSAHESRRRLLAAKAAAGKRAFARGAWAGSVGLTALVLLARILLGAVAP